MPVSSRKPPPTPQHSYQQRAILPSPASPSNTHSTYAPFHGHVTISAPPYDQPGDRYVPSDDPHNPFRNSRNLAYGPTGPAMQSSAPFPISQMASISPVQISLADRPPPQSIQADSITSGRLPFFEAALARSRGEPLPHPPSELVPFHQPVPVYLPLLDRNHPDLVIGYTRSNTVRFTAEREERNARDFSRSPSPGLEESFDGGYTGEYGYHGEQDLEKALLHYQETLIWDEDPRRAAVSGRGWKEKLDSSGFLEGEEEGDLSLPPLHGGRGPESGVPFIHVRGPKTSSVGSRSLSIVDGEVGSSATQHFGPAPSGRVSRRTHNAAGNRRIKQTATLDDNGFFAVDMPIPTRLAQFLPVKGVEEQKSTR